MIRETAVVKYWCYTLSVTSQPLDSTSMHQDKGERVAAASDLVVVPKQEVVVKSEVKVLFKYFDIF